MKKTTNLISILVLLIGISILIAISVTAYNNWIASPQAGRFVKEKNSEALKIYNEVMAFNEIEDYPKTPDEVIELYNKSYRLLYGNMIKDETVIDEVLHQQRKLYTEELLELNTYEQQLEELKSSIESLKEQKLDIIDIKQKPALYDAQKNNKSCTIRITQTGSNFSKFYWNYFLEKDENDKWKILGWKASNEDFE